jgi:hypothetical protein
MKRLLIAPCAAAVLAAFSFEAAAQQVCTMRADLLKMLDGKYKEWPSGQGLIGDRAMLEVFVSDKGTFTIVSSTPNGVSCIIAAGNNWEAMERPASADTAL